MITRRQRLAEYDEGILCADGFDEAIIGVAFMFSAGAVALYDRNKIIEILVTEEGMEYEDAIEHYEFNIAGGYVGEKTPVFCELFEEVDQAKEK